MADRIVFVLTLLLAGVYFWATSKIPSLEIGDPLGPKAFPRLLGVALLITAAVMLYEIFQARKTPAESKPQPAGGIEHYYVLGGVVAWIFCYFLVFEFLGFIISTAIMLTGLTAYFNRNKWVMNVLTSVLFSIGAYVAFVKILGVNLARGIVPF